MFFFFSKRLQQANFQETLKIRNYFAFHTLKRTQFPRHIFATQLGCHSITFCAIYVFISHQMPPKTMHVANISVALTTLNFYLQAQEFLHPLAAASSRDRWSYHTNKLAWKLRAADSIFISINIPANKLKAAAVHRGLVSTLYSDSQAAINWHQIMSRARGGRELFWYALRKNQLCEHRTEIWDAHAVTCRYRSIFYTLTHSRAQLAFRLNILRCETGSGL